MNKEAVEHIQKTAHIPEVIAHLTQHETQIPIVTTPDNMSIHDLEKYMPNASRYRLNFETTSTDDFIDYNKEFAVEGSTCFVNAERMNAKSIFDLGTVELPGHKQSTAKLQLKKTAAFQAIYQINGDAMGQKQAAEFIEDWADFIQVLAQDGSSMNANAAAHALQKLTIESAKSVTSNVHDFGESTQSMDSIEARSEQALPAQINFSCLTYQGLTERTFALRVGILTGGEKPKLVFRILQLEAMEEAIAEEFKDKLVEAFSGSELKTYIGQA